MDFAMQCAYSDSLCISYVPDVEVHTGGGDVADVEMGSDAGRNNTETNVGYLANTQRNSQDENVQIPITH
jgi:hypothetical protein